MKTAQLSMSKVKVEDQGQISSLMGFTITHIHTKLHQFLMKSFSIFVWTDRQTDR